MLDLMKLQARPPRVHSEKAFDDPKQSAVITGPMPDERQFDIARVEIRAKAISVIPEFRFLYQEPLLNKEQEIHLLRKLNFFKHHALKLIQQCNVLRPNPNKMHKIQEFLAKAKNVESQLVDSNCRLVMSLAKKRKIVGDYSPEALWELVSDGNLGLLRAIDYFDYRLGHKFSTYATWAIVNHIKYCQDLRLKYSSRYSTGMEETLDLKLDCHGEPEVPEKDVHIDRILSGIPTRERDIIIGSYGLNGERSKTLGQLGEEQGISKERARQLRERGLVKLRQLVSA